MTPRLPGPDDSRPGNVLEDDSHRSELLERLPRARAMPQIFIDGEHVGSTEDLAHLKSNGALESLLDV